MIAPSAAADRLLDDTGPAAGGALAAAVAPRALALRAGVLGGRRLLRRQLVALRHVLSIGSFHGVLLPVAGAGAFMRSSPAFGLVRAVRGG
jgi:hypothetical protein